MGNYTPTPPEDIDAKIGEMIVLTVEHPDGNADLYMGDVGTVCNTYEGTQYAIGVDFGRKISRGHDCGGSCEYGHGWKLRRGEFSFASPEFQNDIDPLDEDAIMDFLSA